ncbi:MAG: MFS transporter [Burkholderiales bacterium]|nr:MAG: MFS transporter [Burkholderiales bacterium]
MAVFDRSALNPGVAPREVFAWSMYDFANSGFTTVVLTAVFNAYFVGAVAGNAAWATFAWTAALALSSLLVILTMPALGAWADARAAKKPLLFASTIGCVLGTAALSFAQPGTVLLAIVAVIVANYFFSVGESLIASFLPELARPHALGKVSGWGWSFGYFGGMLALGVSLAWVLSAQAAGATAAEFVPVTMWITAGIFAIAAIPTFVLLRERAVPQAPAADRPVDARAATSGGFADALVRLRHTWQEAGRFRDFVRLLWCGACYQAGIAVVVALAAVYAEQAMKFTQTQTMALIFVVNIASAAGAFAFGYAQDRLGHKRALAVTLLGWIAMTLIAGLGTTVGLFWVAATLAGLCMGSSQSCGRAMVGALAPADRLAEFYGLWALALRVAAIVGPLTYGLVTWATLGNHRLAILVTGLFFVAGLALLRGIDMARGEAAALTS